MKNFIINGKCLYVANKKIEFKFLIEKVIFFKEIYLVLLNSDSDKKKWGQFPNLFGLNSALQILWIAELPTNLTGDCYHTLEPVFTFSKVF